MKKYTREISENEIGIARRSHLKVLLFVPVLTLIAYVVYKFELPPFVKIASYILLPAILLIFSKSQLKIAKDIKKGEVTVYEGIILQKFVMGKSNSGRGYGTHGGKRTRTLTYFLKLDEKKLIVSKRVYKKAKVGMHASISMFDNSQYVIDLVEVK